MKLFFCLLFLFFEFVLFLHPFCNFYLLLLLSLSYLKFIFDCFIKSFLEKAGLIV